MNRTVLTATVLLVAAPVLAACGTESTKPAEGTRALTVDSSADGCAVSGTDAPAGVLTFEVSNSSDDVTEFYLLGEDGLRVIGEVENIGAGASNTLTVRASAGDYFTACRPGMKGDGIRSEFTVTESEEGEIELSADDQALVDQAITGYAAYVEDQSAQLQVKTQEFVDLYKAGRDEEARTLYPVARVHWERIETVAESFGTLDPLMDAREADVPDDEEWTGWHRIEKDLWPGRAVDEEGAYTALSTEERAFYADDLMANTAELDELIAGLEYTIDDIANGSRGLLEEVATGKITGEEEYWSRTDLWDFQANVDGAKVAFEGVEPIVEKNDAELADTLRSRFDELQVLLDAQRVGEDGFTFYDDLAAEEVKALADAVNALSEPLSRLTAAVLPEQPTKTATE